MSETEALVETFGAKMYPAWHMVLNFLPPSVNHSYLTTGMGRRVLTRDAKAARESIMWSARETGFTPDSKKYYAIRVRFIFPRLDGGDIDGPIKLLVDGIFGTQADRRIMRLEVEKVVRKGVSRTEV